MITITFLLIIISAAAAQEKKVDIKKNSVNDVKKESIKEVEEVKKKSDENKAEITGEKKEVTEKKVQDKDKTQTLVSDKKRKKLWFSGYMAPVVRFSQVDSTKYSTFVGYKGAFIIEGFAIGTGLFVNADYKKRKIKDKNRDVFMGYTGLLFEYNFLRKKIVNFSVGTLVGIGTAGYFKSGNYDDDNDTEHRYVGTRFFVLEPELVLYINVTRFFRLGLGGSYRYINGLKQYNLTDDSYAGFAGSLILQFGWF